MLQVLIFLVLLFWDIHYYNFIPNNCPLQSPLDDGVITSNMGYRGKEMHVGVDISTTKNTLIKPIGEGIIHQIGYNPNYGNYIVIYHTKLGLYSRYAHLNKVYVTKNSIVNRHLPIGTIGLTGKTTGYHLHLEIYNVNNIFLNPLDMIRNHNLKYSTKITMLAMRTPK